MNQTTWVVGGGIIMVAIAGLLYLSSGDGMKPSAKNATETIPAAEITVDGNPIATSSPTMEQQTNEATSAVLRTSMGDIAIKFYPSDAPKTVENFLNLAKSGFYDGVRFHRVIKGFMIQTGDPLSKDDTQMERWGTGGPGTKFNDEIDRTSALYQRGYKHGVVAMANSGPNTNGSQFFIMAADYPLPPSYTIFGEVTDGLAVVDAIDAVQTDGPAQAGGHDRPLVPVTIKSVEIK